MRLFILLFMLHGLLSVSGQSITKSEIDKFTKAKRVQTSKELLLSKLKNGMWVSIRSVDTTYFINFSGYGNGADVIGERDAIIFLFENESTLTIHPTGIQSYDVGRQQNTYSHQYYITSDGLQQLSTHKVKSIRKYSSSHYNDIEIPEKHNDVMMNLSKIFIEEITK